MVAPFLQATLICSAERGGREGGFWARLQKTLLSVMKKEMEKEKEKEKEKEEKAQKEERKDKCESQMLTDLQ